MKTPTESIEALVRERTRWWTSRQDGAVQCQTCPRACLIKPGRAGFCFVRQNVAGALVGLGYGQPTGFSADPVEKKPLYHFLPGSEILSFGTVGCNLGCRFCQNWHMSRSRELPRTRFVPPEEVVRLAKQAGCPAIAFTYNEPTIFAEYAIDIAQAAREQGLRCVAVTAGYISPEPRVELFRELAATNIDLKGFSDDFYTRWSRAHLQPVLDTIREVHESTSCWIELTNLIVPGLNDGEAELHGLAEWILEVLGPDVPLHFSAFHPAGRLTDRPRTPLATLLKARTIARTTGLHHIYLGNLPAPDGGTTRCPSCSTLLVAREGYQVEVRQLQDGRCGRCGAPIPGVWS
jgi:pyruvate formate lyase activating enzyme